MNGSEVCKKCRKAPRLKNRVQCEVCAKKAREVAKRTGKNLKNKVISAYGKECAKCGVTDDLSIDHVKCDGREHRLAIGALDNRTFHRWIIANGFPPGFRVLCHPCNSSAGSDSPIFDEFESRPKINLFNYDQKDSQ